MLPDKTLLPTNASRLADDNWGSCYVDCSWYGYACSGEDGYCYSYCCDLDGTVYNRYCSTIPCCENQDFEPYWADHGCPTPAPYPSPTTPAPTPVPIYKQVLQGSTTVSEYGCYPVMLSRCWQYSCDDVVDAATSCTDDSFLATFHVVPPSEGKVCSQVDYDTSTGQFVWPSRCEKVGNQYDAFKELQTYNENVHMLKHILEKHDDFQQLDYDQAATCMRGCECCSSDAPHAPNSSSCPHVVFLFLLCRWTLPVVDTWN